MKAYEILFPMPFVYVNRTFSSQDMVSYTLHLCKLTPTVTNYLFKINKKYIYSIFHNNFLKYG